MLSESVLISSVPEFLLLATDTRGMDEIYKYFNQLSLDSTILPVKTESIKATFEKEEKIFETSEQKIERKTSTQEYKDISESSNENVVNELLEKAVSIVDKITIKNALRRYVILEQL